MTSRERFLAAMRFDRVDRVPVAPFGLGRLNPDSPAASEIIEKTDPFIECTVAGDYFFGVGCETETRREGNTVTIIRRTPLGDLTQVNRSTGITSACVEHPLKTPEDAEKFLSIDYTAPEVDASEFHACRQRIGEQGLVCCCVCDGVTLPAQLLSPDDFCLWWADYPDLLLELTAVGSSRANEWVRRLCGEGVDAIRVVGGEYASVQLGPDAFDTLVVEQDRELVDIVHSHGGVVLYHNHGPVMRYMTRFAKIGMDALDPLEAPPWGDADLRAAREECGDSVTFVGNLDDMEILEKLPASDVRRMAAERLEAAGSRGFILGGTTSGTYAEKAARNFIEMVAVAEMFASRAS